MNTIKKWKNFWEVKSFTFEELYNLIISVIQKQVPEINKKSILLEANLYNDCNIDSVDVMAILLHLEEILTPLSKSKNNTTLIDTSKQTILVEDIVDIIYETILMMENNMSIYKKIKPNLEILKNIKSNSI